MVRTLSELGYMIAFDGHRTPYSDRCVKEGLKGGVVLGVEKDGSFAGYISAVAEGSDLRVLYAYTLPEERGKGVFSELLKALTRHDILEKHGTQAMRVSISVRHPFHDTVTAACLNAGFTKTESVTVFTCRRGRDEHWRIFMEEKGDRMCTLLRRWGYETVSFEEAGDEILSQLRDPEGHGYGNTFDVAPFLDDPARKTAYDMSFAAVLERKLAAYTLVTRDSGEGVVFQIISDAVWARGSGVILLPFAESMKSFYEGGCKTALYAMYGSNREANAFRESVLGGFYTESSETENYYF